MKRLVIILFVLVLCTLSYAQETPDWAWAVRAGGTGDNMGYDIATDASISGYHEHEVFVAKIDSNGNWIWASTNQGYAEDIGMGIATDGNFVYVTGGSRAGTFGDTTIATSGAYAQIFVAKMSSRASGTGL
jgi:hypothetical protein